MTMDGQETQKRLDPRPPVWMSRPEKRLFASIVEARKDLNRPVLSGEVDVLCDLISCRSRIATLKKMADDAVATAGPNVQHQRHAAGLLRQVDAATALARRLTKDLGLISTERR